MFTFETSSESTQRQLFIIFFEIRSTEKAYGDEYTPQYSLDD